MTNRTTIVEYLHGKAPTRPAERCDMPVVAAETPSSADEDVQPSPASPPVVSFSTAPDRYRHWRLEVDGEVATATLTVDENGGLVAGYELKMNSYDLGVDVDAKVVGVHLQLVAGHQTAVLVNGQGRRGHIPIHFQAPVAVAVRGRRKTHDGGRGGWRLDLLVGRARGLGGNDRHVTPLSKSGEWR